MIALVIGAFSGLLAGSSLCGCTPAGHEPYARWQVLEVGEGAYTLRYLSPPWELTAVDGTSAELFIESGAMRLFPDGGQLPKYSLITELRSGSPESLATMALSTATAAGQEVVEGPRMMDGGWELLTRRTDLERHYRYVFLEHPSGSLAMRFEATPELDNEEVNAMIRGVEIGAP